METLKDVVTRMLRQHLDRQSKTEADTEASQNSENSTTTKGK